jgi:RNA polymerase sigma-70 factor, ECF subfamily
MNDLAERFETLRPRLLRLAYSQLGSLAEAEDVVQEAWLRLQRADAAAIEDLQAWLLTVVGRLALDALNSARMRRERCTSACGRACTPSSVTHSRARSKRGR